MTQNMHYVKEKGVCAIIRSVYTVLFSVSLKCDVISILSGLYFTTKTNAYILVHYLNEYYMLYCEFIHRVCEKIINRIEK